MQVLPGIVKNFSNIAFHPSNIRQTIILSTSKEEKTPAAKSEKGGLTVEQLLKADLGMLSDEDLEKGIKTAAEAEEYRLASRLRDELKGRKEGEGNV